MAKHRKLMSQQCSICDESFESDNSILVHRTRRQTHIWCVDCGQTYLTMKLRDKSHQDKPNFTIQCTGYWRGHLRNSCPWKVDVRKLTIPPQLANIHHLIAKIAALQLPGAKECLKCEEVLSIPDGLTRIECPHCQQTWCLHCKISPYHDNKICQTDDLLAVLAQNPEDRQMLAYIKEHGIQPCPQCHQAIEKTGGCNKMVCKYCSVKWCWLCRATDIDYDHFNSEQGTESCRGRLFQE